MIRPTLTPPPDPPLPGGQRAALQQALLGAWHLRSYVEEREGSGAHHPLGREAGGSLIYTPDGCVSVLMMRADRPAFASGDWFRPTPDEVAAASAFIAYSGRYVVDEAARTVAHDIDVSFFPNWIGHRQVRTAELEGDELILTPTAPILSEGRLVVPRLRWRRTPAADGARPSRAA